MSAAAKFRQLGLLSCLIGFVFFLFSGLFVCFVSNAQIYLPFSHRCQRGFEIPFLYVFFENGEGRSVSLFSLKFILGKFWPEGRYLTK